MLTRTMRYEIRNPINVDWGIFQVILKEIQYNAWIASNIVVQQLWAFDHFSRGYFHRTGKSVDLSKEPIMGNNGNSYTTVVGDIANEISPFMKKAYSAHKDAVIRAVYKRWSIMAKDIRKGEVSVPSYKRNLPIEIHNKQMMDSKKCPLIYKTKNIYSIGIKLISKEYANELGLTNTTIELNLVTKEKAKRDILEQLANKEYKLSGSKLQYKNKKWFLLLVYSFENNHRIKQKQDIEPTVMGIDIGIHYPVFIAFNNRDARYKIDGGEITEFRKRVEARRIDMLKQSKYSGEGRKGHGRNTLLKPTEVLRNCITDFRNTTNHRYSSFIIKMAEKHKASIIQMEDLTEIVDKNKKSTFLGNWTYYDLQKKIIYKAEAVGIKIKKIKPAYTSQRCSRCGFISKDNRDWKNNSKSFKCMLCGFETLADFNAAQNIATLNIENIINRTLKKQVQEK